MLQPMTRLGQIRRLADTWLRCLYGTQASFTREDIVLAYEHGQREARSQLRRAMRIAKAGNDAAVGRVAREFIKPLR